MLLSKEWIIMEKLYIGGYSKYSKYKKVILYKLQYIYNKIDDFYIVDSPETSYLYKCLWYANTHTNAKNLASKSSLKYQF